MTRSERTARRRNIAAAAKTAVCAVLLAPTIVHAAPQGPLASCMAHLVVSPAFATDGTAFCAGNMHAGATFTLAVTHDHAKTWTSITPTGITLPPDVWYNVAYFAISPDFATDRTLVLELTPFVFYSTDAGVTFVQAVGGNNYGRLTMADALNGISTSATHGVLLSANHGTTPTTQSAVIDPALPLPRPVAGTGTPDKAFLVPPVGSPDPAYAVGESGSTPSTTQHSFYACNTAYACATKLGSFPLGRQFDQAWFAPSFATSGVVFATTIEYFTDRLHIYVSRDRAQHFDPVPVLSAALDEAYRAKLNPMLVLAPAKPGSHTLFARIAAGGRDPKSPTDRLFRSDDDGKSWRVVAWGRAPWGHGPTGTMPFNYTYPPGTTNGTPQGLLTYTSDGRLLIPGMDAKYTRVVWCSVDGGRTWRPACR